MIGELTQMTVAMELSGVSHLTRSGRCYASSAQDGQKKEAAPMANASGEKVKDYESGKVKATVNEKEATEFLKFIKHSEYSIVDQLSKQPAKISVLSLLLHSEVHRNALLKVLNEAYVPPDISVDKLDRLVNNIVADNYISFTDDEIPPGGRGSYKALHITTHCRGRVLPKVLIDNGSALNVMPLITLKKLPVDASHIKHGHTVVRAFDGTCREVIGNITIPLQVGPCTYEVDFQVMDISPSYNCLLGRPWIHTAGAVPSSLHQKLKFIIDDKVVSVGAEEEMVASTFTGETYIEPNEDTPEPSFQSFEFVNATFVGEGLPIVEPHLSKSTYVGLKLTVGKGCQAGKGLGRYLQGTARALEPVGQIGKKGLGFKPDHMHQKQQAKKAGAQRFARLRDQDEGQGHMMFPSIRETFRSRGCIDPNQPAKKKPEDILVILNQALYDLHVRDLPKLSNE